LTSLRPRARVGAGGVLIRLGLGWSRLLPDELAAASLTPRRPLLIVR
jgi:hypothetical protein